MGEGGRVLGGLGSFGREKEKKKTRSLLETYRNAGRSKISRYIIIKETLKEIKWICRTEM